MKATLNGIDISESALEIQKMMENCSREESSKLQFIFVVKENNDMPIADLSDILKIPSRKIMMWKNLYEQGGLNLLLDKEGDSYPADQKEGEGLGMDVYKLKQWIIENYMTQKECMAAINDLKKMIVAQEETVSVLKRIIKILEGV